MIVPLRAIRGPSTPIDHPSRWHHLPTGIEWTEKAIDARGRTILHTPTLRGLPARGVGPEIRLYRPERDPGTGASLLAAPHWIRV